MSDDPAEPDWSAVFPDGQYAAESVRVASEKWREVCARLRGTGALRGAEATVEILAVNYARWQMAERHIRQRGVLVAAPRTGLPIENPYLAVSQRSAAIVIKIEARLGFQHLMAPSSSERPE